MTKEIDNVPEEELVQHAQQGELAAFEQLVARHQQRVYLIARRITGQPEDAEDVTQQTFLSAVEHLSSFRGEASFATWIGRIATHAALKVIRKRAGGRLLSLEEQSEASSEGEPPPHPEYIADWRKGPAELAFDDEVRRAMDAALASLDEKYRLVFVLRDVEGASVKETAEQLGLTEANVKVRLLRARLFLREQLTRRFGDPTRIVKPHRHL